MRQRKAQARLGGFWPRHAALTCALVVAACVGQEGFRDTSEGGAGGGSSASSSSSGGAESGAAAPDGGGASPESGAPLIPFQPFSVPAYVTKVKTILTGLAPTQAEIDAVTADASSLGGLVTAWMQLPQYGPKMELFFADAFQQSQAQSIDFVGQIDDGGFAPFDELLGNFRASFAKTVTALVAEGQPFTATVTTTRYMMTTAMMTYYAYADTSMLTDATAAGGGSKLCRFYDDNPNWSFQLTAQNVSLAESGDPTSSNYLSFSIPGLAAQYDDTSLGAAGATECGGIDPVVFDNSSSFALGDNLCNWLYSVMLGGNFWYFDPPQGNPNAYWCQGASKFPDRPTHPRLLTASDYSDWRMVTITQATSETDQTRFFDLVGNRASSSLTLYEPRVGYFTTPAFYSQYPTNISNQARATIDQTMIVGLGQAFDGSDPITVKNAPGLDPTHAADAACFACHWSLDPMARFFRSNLTMNYSTQQDPTQTAVTGTFLFDSVVGTAGTSLGYLASQIAAHPQFKTAWTLKLCGWANSGACLATDPEVQRVAQVFASSNYNWGTLVHELFTSPLVTYTAPTLSTQTTGTVVPIARRTQLCTTLNSRLGLSDVCGYNLIPLAFGSSGTTSALPSPPFCSCADDPGAGCTGTCGDPGPVPPVAAQLPTDGYSRGVAQALYINGPDPFYRSSIEQICAYVADLVVDSGTDAGGAPLYSSATPAAVTSAITNMAHGLMGLDSSRDAQPISILTSHYSSAVSGGHTPTDALKSTFTAACLSPWVVSVGE
jgi:hypothetical protein